MNITQKKLISTITAIVILLTIGIFFYLNAFSAPQKEVDFERFIISTNGSLNDSSEIAEKLKADGFIKHTWAFNLKLLGLKSITGVKCVDCISIGAYKISKSMSVSEIVDIFNHKPYMVWVSFSEGLRKEEIADILSSQLGWSDEEKEKWITVDTTKENDYIEGVYFPDTYLIPIDENPLAVAERLITHFEENFTPYLKEAQKQNIKWTTVLKIASLVQREAGGKEDMSIIAGIIWNRLLQDIKLDIDATLQYARGDKGDGWWAPITVIDKQTDSPYNTYLYKGLPPHPISNPGLSAIEAVLNPTPTDCIYYLHDSNKKIHCARTYKEHKQNIEVYLK